MGFRARTRCPRACVAGPVVAFALLAAPAFAQATTDQTAPVSDPAASIAQQYDQAPTTFPVYAIDVVGAKILQPVEIERLIYPFTGEKRTGKEIEAARKAIQDAYAAKGYEAVVVEIPPQINEQFAQGVVRIDVHESPVGRVRVVDSRFHALSVVRKQIPSVQEGQPLNLRALQRDIEYANRFPDRSVSPTFKAGQVPNTLDVDLKVDDQRPWHASAEVNNDHSPNTSSLRTTATARYTNLWGQGHGVSFTYSVAPQKRSESEVFSGSYTMPLIGSPWSFMLFGYKSNSNVAALGGTNVLGDGYQVGLRAVYRLPSQGSYQAISFGPDFKNFQQDILVGGVPAGSAPIRYVPFVAEYSVAGGSDYTSFDMTLGATVGVRAIKRHLCINTAAQMIAARNDCDEGLPDRQLVDQFNNRSFDSSENFVHVNLGLNYSRSTKSDIVGVFRFSGQYSDTPLITNEQFAIGGLSNVRGYLQSEAVGDQGLSASFELRSPSLDRFVGAPLDELRVFVFVDGGWARVRHALAEQKDDFKLLSAGGGARIKLFNFLTGEVLAGVPLRDGPNSKQGDARLIFVARGEF